MGMAERKPGWQYIVSRYAEAVPARGLYPRRFFPKRRKSAHGRTLRATARRHGRWRKREDCTGRHRDRKPHNIATDLVFWFVVSACPAGQRRSDQCAVARPLLEDGDFRHQRRIEPT